jgi:hypothetical protein
MSTDIYVLNRCPMKSMDGMTQFEAWHGKKPVVHHLKIFGCIIYVQNTMPHLKKLEDRGRKMIFIGYECGSKVYCAYDPIMKRVHVMCNVVFNEQDQWDWSTGGNDSEPGSGDNVFTVEYMTNCQAALETEEVDEEPAEQSPLPAMDDNAEFDNDINNVDVDYIDTEIDDDVNDDNLNANHDDNAPLRFRNNNDILETAEFMSCALVVEELHMVSSDELTTFTEAECNPS